MWEAAINPLAFYISILVTVDNSAQISVCVDIDRPLFLNYYMLK